MAESNPESSGHTMSPEEVILYSFAYLQKTVLTLDELINFAAEMHSPSPEVTQTILANLIEQGKIEWRKDRGVVYFRLRPDSDKLPNNKMN